MASKAELYEKAQELDISGRSTMDKGQLEKAIAKAERGATAAAEDAVAEREERRKARREEAALAAANRAENEAEAKAQVRTGPQQALDRAQKETE